MTTTRSKVVKGLKGCRNCGRWKEAKEKIRILELLDEAIQKMEAKLKADDFKPTVADYLKLMQLEQELDRDEAKEIKVTWVEPTATSPEK
jgi:hypothetical protein